MAMTITEVISRFNGVKRLNSGSYQAKCPCHNDSKASLTISQGAEGKILLKCHANCETENIINAVGLTWKDINGKEEDKRPLPTWKKDLVAEYKYYEPYTNRYLYSKLRYEKNGEKKILYAVIDGDQVVKWEKNPGDHALYNVNRLIQAIKRGYPVYYAEGEKDCDNLMKLGYVCVTSGGVGDWRKEYAQYFKGAKKVYILGDNDEPGKKHVYEVVSSLREYVWDIAYLFPSDQEKGDISDVLETIATKEEKHRKVKDLLTDPEVTKNIQATWLYTDGGKVKVNADLLADVFIRQNHFIAVNDGMSESNLYYSYANGVYSRMTREHLKSEVKRYFPLGKATTKVINEVVGLIMSGADIVSPDDLDNNIEIINVKNGLVDISTGDLKPHTPDILSTVQLDCNYDPNNQEEPSNWNKVINDLCTFRNEEGIEEVDQDMKAALLEYLGLIISNIPGYKVKTATILFSPNGNVGKSILVSVIAALIGSEYIANISLVKMGSSRWATSQAYGKRLIAVGDESGTEVSSSATFKELTGGDSVSAEFKGKDSFNYLFKGCIMVNTNTLPYFADDKGNHLLERLMILHCRNSIPTEKRDKFLTEKCVAERDIIFLQLLGALQRLRRNNLTFTRCESGDKAKAEYRMQSDTVYHFICERCEISDGGHIPCSQFYNSYERFCDENKRTPVKRYGLKNRMESLGYLVYAYQGIDSYKGINFKPLNDTANETDIPY